MSFFEELRRRNVVKVAMLYLVASWLVLQVGDVLFEALELPASWLRLVLALLVLGFPLALIFSWVYELTPEGIKREKDIDRTRSVTAHTGHRINILIVALLVLAIAFVAFDRLVPESEPDLAEETTDEPAAASADEREDPTLVAAAKFAPAPDRSIAVLPFVNMSGDKENEYFADGVSEEILNFLAGVPDLRVTARTSSFQFKGRNVDVREVGSALNVAHVLEGSVRQSGERARITAQLIRADDGYHLWSETYDRTLEDTLEVQTDIASSVTRALGVVLDESQRQRMIDVGVRDVEAFIAFQKARDLFHDAHSRGGVDMAMMAEAAARLSDVIALEPRFSEAYFLRSDFYAHTATMEGVADAERSAAYRSYQADLTSAMEHVRSPGQRALIEVDRSLSGNDWSRLPEHLEAALSTRGCLQPVWVELAPIFGYASEALEFRRGMIECDPLNALNYTTAAYHALWQGEPDKALGFARRGLEMAPDDPYLQGTEIEVLMVLGRLEEARQRAERLAGWNRDVMLVQMDAALGNLEAARAALPRVWEKTGPWFGPYYQVQLYGMVGDREKANEVAAWYDGIPAGPMMLAAITLDCMCGAPFDLDVTPNFRRLLEEAGVDWPPPVLIPSLVNRR